MRIAYPNDFMSHPFIFIALVCGGRIPELLAQTPQPPKPADHYQLVFSDEFTTLDLGTGEHGSFASLHKWYEGVWFSPHRTPIDHFVTENSALSLIWKQGQVEPDSSISTFSVHSPNYHAWRYGYFEARMKWHPEEGAWPAFWLIPIQAAKHGSMESGEIDIFEGQGSDPHTFFGTIHHWNGAKQLASSSGHNHFSLPLTTDFSQYHTYGLLWVPGRVTWYFDNVPLHSEPTYDIFDKQDYFLVIGMQEGSDWKSGDLSGVTAQSLTLTVDWVRVWQLHSN